MLNFSAMTRWNTPTMYNGLEMLQGGDRLAIKVNKQETRDFMPQMGPIVGRALTVVIEPGNRKHTEVHPTAWREYREYVAEGDYPKIIVVQDLDGEPIGSFWGEVNSGIHLALGCVGTITDGAIRDLDEMSAVGFKALAKRLCVGHCYSHPVKWNCPVSVFGCDIRPGQLIHADKHGFLVIPESAEECILEAAEFMDRNECTTVIPASRNTTGKTRDEILKAINEAASLFDANASAKFGASGEW